MKNLGELIDGIYVLSDFGKEEIVNEVSNRLNNHEKKVYEDEKFESLATFICSNFSNTLSEALNYGLTGKEKVVYRLLKKAQNERKLNQWFEAVAKDINLSGSDIMNYFMSNDYQQYVKKYGWSTKISGLTNFILNNKSQAFINVCKQNVYVKKAK